MFLTRKSSNVGNAWRFACLCAFIILASVWANEAKAKDPCRVIFSREGGLVETAIYYISVGALPEFDPMLPVGSPLAHGDANMGNDPANIYCDPYIGNYVYSGMGVLNGTYQTFPTSIAGIGVRVGFLMGGTASWWDGTPDFTSANGFNFVPGSAFRIQLVKTGPITAGGSLSGEIAYMKLLDFNKKAISIRLSGSVPVRPLVPACKVTSPTNINVPFGAVSHTTLKDNPASAAKSFSIKLECSGGTQGATTRMFMGMTDVSTPGNTSDILTLSSDSKAKGVGVKILRDGVTPVMFTPDASVAGGSNQWQVGQFANVDVDIPFTAYYVSTGGAITGGTANAAATYTISYQ